ncbi:hypothetical protein BKA69DRAFT_1050928 [Paraphysoderma sedebokerense]|nr:hypothetical protein BKA69DRAFT_1050861 [Paraphysoderma sedebokerense]KAI9145351.1 hypothetical protein BKA69DRAFT_1050928 [Paraphysoderma sedebokerense]
MLEKLENRHFGVCPRTFCYNFPLLPVGRYDQPGLDTVKVYCYNCMDIYNPSGSRYQRVDGAFFGSTFPHLLFQTFPDYYASLLSLLQPKDAIPSLNPSSTSSPVPSSSDFDTDAHADIRPKSRLRSRPQGFGHSRSSSLTESTSLQQLYVPKIFGFRVHESSKAGPKATWLRWQPGDDIKSGKGKRESDRNLSHMSSTSSSSSPHSYLLSTSNLPNSSSSNTAVGHRSTSSVHSLQQSNPNLQQQHSSLANSGPPSGGKTNVGVGPGVNMTIPSSSSAFSLPGIGGLSMSMSSGQDLPRSNNSSSFNMNVGSMSLDEAGSAGMQTKMTWSTGNDDEVNLGSAMIGVQMSGDTKR